LEGIFKGEDLKFTTKQPNNDHFDNFTNKTQNDKLKNTNK